MKKSFLKWSHCGLLAVVMGSPTVALAELKEFWRLEAPLENPESVYHDPVTDYIFVSSVAGSPDAKDGRGWISKLTADGKVVAAKWIDGLHAPKGMRASNGTLWVTNIDELVGISMADGKLAERIPIEGAKFLNDIAIGNDGTVYVSDTVTSTIYALMRGKVSVLIKGPQLQHPNGLLWRDGKLIVAGWGSELAPDWSTKKAGGLYSIDPASKKIKVITQEPLGHLDGLESDGNGGFYVSDWSAGKVFRISRGGVPTEILTGVKNSADIGLIIKANTLLVPAMGGNLLIAYGISTPATAKSVSASPTVK